MAYACLGWIYNCTLKTHGCDIVNNHNVATIALQYLKCVILAHSLSVHLCMYKNVIFLLAYTQYLYICSNHLD